MDAPTRRYAREFALTMTVYVATIIASSLTLLGIGDSPWRILVALAPVIPVIVLLVVFMRYLTAVDELQQRIQLMAIGFSAGATALLTFTYGFMENLGFPRLSYFYVFSLMIVLWGFGVHYYSRRYQ